MGDTQLEVLGYSFRFCDHVLRDDWGQDFFCGFGEEGEPTLEVVRIEGELEMGHERLPLVAASSKQDGGPEVFESREVMGPIADNGIEDGADLGVFADFGVEGVDQDADFGFGDFRFHAGSFYSLGFEDRKDLLN